MRAIGLTKVATFYAVMGCVALVSMWVRSTLHLLVPSADLSAWAISLALGLGVGLAVVVVSRVATARFTWASRLAEEFRTLLGELTTREALLIAVMSGTAEEALFRGVLQPALGLYLGAAVFAVLHVGPNIRFLPWTIMAFGAGLVFGAMLEWTGNLLAPTLAHTTVNFLNLRYLCLPKNRQEVHLGPVGGEGAAGVR